MPTGKYKRTAIKQICINCDDVFDTKARNAKRCFSCRENYRPCIICETLFKPGHNKTIICTVCKSLPRYCACGCGKELTGHISRMFLKAHQFKKPIHRDCGNCGKPLIISPSQAKSKQSFCDLSCLAKWHSQTWEKKYGIVRAGEMKRKYVKSYHKGIMDGTRKLPINNISHKHAGWYTKKNGHKIYLRSSWEFAFARLLDEAGEPWTYESKRFKLSSGVYVPDFHLTNKGLFIEIKNPYLYEKQKYRFEEFEKIYPDINLLIITKKQTNIDWLLN